MNYICNTCIVPEGTSSKSETDKTEITENYTTASAYFGREYKPCTVSVQEPGLVTRKTVEREIIPVKGVEMLPQPSIKEKVKKFSAKMYMTNGMEGFA